MEPMTPLCWQYRVLTTEPPGKPPETFFFSLNSVLPYSFTVSKRFRFRDSFPLKSTLLRYNLNIMKCSTVWTYMYTYRTTVPIKVQNSLYSQKGPLWTWDFKSFPDDFGGTSTFEHCWGPSAHVPTVSALQSQRGWPVLMFQHTQHHLGT